MSTTFCGCDAEANHLCERHSLELGGVKPLTTALPPSFIIKDSGQRQEFSGGMVRDVTDGKVDYSLIYDGPMFDRWAEHLTKGAKKYARQNWLLAQGEEELLRYKISAARHFRQWMRGDFDEDHAAAVFFNINGYEYVLAKIIKAP